MRKAAAVVYFKKLTRYLARRSEEKHEKSEWT
jgi:hypothetical protein